MSVRGGRTPDRAPATAFAHTITTIASHADGSSRSPSTRRPTSAASTGLMLMKMPKKWAGTRRNASMSASSGTAEDSSPAVSAHASATSVTGRCQHTSTPTGTYASADTVAATAEPSSPGSRRPTVRLSRM